MVGRMNHEKMWRVVRIIWTVVVYIFAAIGFGLVVTYFAVRFGLTNTTGIIDLQRETFLGNATSTAAITQTPEYPSGTPWQNTEEWQVLSAAATTDAPAINRAAAVAGITPRLLVEDLVVEQLRLFFTERAFYKQFFAPLKILGSQTQFSWGVMGMKEATAVQVENNLKDPTSPYYLGPQYEHLLDFAPVDPTNASSTITEQRFTRMTNSHDHYYNYLYASLYLKELETQWSNAGFPIDAKPDVLATLYNIGFEHSTPNANPQVGGAAIVINNVTYSFGGLASQFYNSNLLTDVFPK